MSRSWSGIESSRAAGGCQQLRIGTGTGRLQSTFKFLDLDSSCLQRNMVTFFEAKLDFCVANDSYAWSYTYW
jgi:hypothetical protein